MGPKSRTRLVKQKGRTFHCRLLGIGQSGRAAEGELVYMAPCHNLNRAIVCLGADAWKWS